MPLDSTTFEPEVVRDLRAGRAYLVKHGWTQNQTRDGDRVCAIGALQMVAKSQGDRLVAWEALQRALGDGTGVGMWNDAPDRTIEDVLALYDLTIKHELTTA